MSLPLSLYLPSFNFCFLVIRIMSGFSNFPPVKLIQWLPDWAMKPWVGELESLQETSAHCDVSV